MTTSRIPEAGQVWRDRRPRGGVERLVVIRKIVGYDPPVGYGTPAIVVRTLRYGREHGRHNFIKADQFPRRYEFVAKDIKHLEPGVGQ